MKFNKYLTAAPFIWMGPANLSGHNQIRQLSFASDVALDLPCCNTSRSNSAAPYQRPEHEASLSRNHLTNCCILTRAESRKLPDDCLCKLVAFLPPCQVRPFSRSEKHSAWRLYVLSRHPFRIEGSKVALSVSPSTEGR